MSDTSHAHADSGAHDAGHMGKYVAVVVALCFLSAMSFWTNSETYWPSALDTPAVKRMFMMAVSCTKAMLVILFFMHVKYEANWKYVLTIPASIMSVFLVVALVPDIYCRINGFASAGGKYAKERRSRQGVAADQELLWRAQSLAADDEPHVVGDSLAH